MIISPKFEWFSISQETDEMNFMNFYGTKLID